MIGARKLTQINQGTSIIYVCACVCLFVETMLTQEKVLGTGRFSKWPVTGKSELKAFQGGNLLIRKAGFV